MKNKFLKELILRTGIYDIKYIAEEDIKNYPPEKVAKKDGYNYFFDDRELSPDEINTALIAKQTLYIRTIRNLVIVYFTLSAVAAVIVFFSALLR